MSINAATPNTARATLENELQQLREEVQRLERIRRELESEREQENAQRKKMMKIIRKRKMVIL